MSGPGQWYALVQCGGDGDGPRMGSSELELARLREVVINLRVDTDRRKEESGFVLRLGVSVCLPVISTL